MSAASLSDRELLAAWRDGDREAADELIERYGPALYGFFAAKVRHGADLLCLRTFTAWQRPPTEETPGGVRASLLALARRALLEHLRPSGTELDPRERSLAELEPGLTEVVAAAAPERQLQQGLRRLPIDDQLGLELRYFEGLDDDEIAAVLGSDTATTPRRLSAAAQRLQRWLEGAHAVADDTIQAAASHDDRSSG